MLSLKVSPTLTRNQWRIIAQESGVKEKKWMHLKQLSQVGWNGKEAKWRRWKCIYTRGPPTSRYEPLGNGHATDRWNRWKHRWNRWDTRSSKRTDRDARPVVETPDRCRRSDHRCDTREGRPVVEEADRCHRSNHRWEVWIFKLLKMKWNGISVEII